MKRRAVNTALVLDILLEIKGYEAVEELCLAYADALSDDHLRRVIAERDVYTAHRLWLYTKRRCNREIVKKLLGDGDHALHKMAFNVLDETCDLETFRSVILKGQDADLILDALNNMKRLGHKRDWELFSRLVRCRPSSFEVLKQVYEEMVAECGCATREAFQEILDAAGGFDQAWFAVKESRAKGIKLNAKSFVFRSALTVEDAVALVEVCDDAQLCFQFILDKRASSLNHAWMVVHKAKSVGVKIQLDAFLRLLYHDSLGQPQVEEIARLLEEVHEEDVDTGAARLVQLRFFPQLFKHLIATRQQQRGFSRCLAALARSYMSVYQLQGHAVLKGENLLGAKPVFEAFCKIVKPDVETCVVMVRQLWDSGNVTEAKSVFNVYRRLHGSTSPREASMFLPLLDP